MYIYTKDYVCDYCGKRQTKDEQVYALCGDYLRFEDKTRHACKDCIKKGLAKGYSIGDE